MPRSLKSLCPGLQPGQVSPLPVLNCVTLGGLYNLWASVSSAAKGVVVRTR